jgi:hypothetical protein
MIHRNSLRKRAGVKVLPKKRHGALCEILPRRRTIEEKSRLRKNDAKKQRAAPGVLPMRREPNV